MSRRPKPKTGPPRKAYNACVETWIDRGILATLGSYFYRLDNPPRSMSELVRMSLTELADILVQNELAIRVDDPVEATRALERINAGAINRSGRGLSTYLKLQQKKELGAGDPYLTIRAKADALKAGFEAELDEGLVMYWMNQGMTREEAQTKIAKGREEFDEQASTTKSQLRDQAEKDALAQGPDQSSIVTEEE